MSSEKYILGRQYVQLIIRSQRMWRSEADTAFAEAGFSFSSFLCMECIERMGAGSTQVLIADELGIRGPTLVRQLDLLEKDGYIVKKDSSDDRRAKIVALSPKGRNVLKRNLELLINMIETRLDGVTPAELRSSIRVFEKILSRGDIAPAENR